MTVRIYRDGKLAREDILPPKATIHDALWIDLFDPTEEECAWISETYGLHVPGPASIKEIEATSRFFEDDEGLHLRTYFLQELPDGWVNLTVSFTLRQGRLFTLHYQEIPALTEFANQLAATPEASRAPWSILLGLFEDRIDRTADVLERLYAEVDDHTQTVFRIGEANLEQLIHDMANAEDTNGKARLSLMDKQRVLALLQRSGKLPETLTPWLHELLRDTDSLLAHSTSLFEKIDLLMDVTMGKITIEQNKVIRILSLVALIFLPPTLIASLYGMNFRFMPELDWRFGYPFAVLLMILSGVLPYAYFKHRNWL